MILMIAWRNIWRHPVRSILIVCSVIIGLWAGLFTIAFSLGMTKERVESAIRDEVSYLQVHHPAFKEDYDINYVIPSGITVMEEVKTMPGIRGAAGRFIAKGMLSTAHGTSGIKINGIIPEAEKRVTNLQQKITEGAYFEGGTRSPIIISEKLARKMKVKLNSKVVLTFQGKESEIITGAFRIAGIYRTVNSPYDMMNVFVQASDINALLGTETEINEIAVLINEPDEIYEIKSRLSVSYPLLLTEDWMQIAPELNLLVSTYDEYMDIFIGIIMIGLAFGIINTMLMAVLERTREIGMLMAIGMNKIKVFTMILVETFYLMLAGSPIGILLAMLTVLYFGKTGIDLYMFSAAFQNFGISTIAYPYLEGDYYLRVLAFVTITAFISSLYPAYKAIKIVPAESIRRVQ
jgi:ABC-type lipoprotein release transport system permease subunit